MHSGMSMPEDDRIVPPGVRLSQRRAAAVGRPALFLDRDGVIVEERGYLRSPGDVALMPGIAAALARARALDVPAVAVTNQSGIDRGLFGWSEFARVEAEIDRQLHENGAALDFVLACPFHPDFTADFGETHAHWRKPGPGMLLRAAELLGLDLSRSWMIGDKADDVRAARAAGLRGAIHVLSGHGASERGAVAELEEPGFAVVAANTPGAAAATALDSILAGR